MLDFTHIPNNKNNVQVFTNPGTWETWIKPRGAKVVNILCVGAGGGGGSGNAGGDGNNDARWGGGGGASGGITRATFIASALPDILYVQTGLGGDGGLGVTGSSGGGNMTIGNVGSLGGSSFVSIYPTSSALFLVCAATGGNGGPVNSNNAKAASTGASTQANAFFLQTGLYNSIPTVEGGKATGSSPSPDIYAFTFSLVTSGCGATSPGTTTNDGSSIQPSSVFLTTPVAGSQGSNSAVGYKIKTKDGEDGYGFITPIFCGTGGASSGGQNYSSFNAADIPTTGNGGNGFYGCGGGASSGGAWIVNTALNRKSISGNGGRGGDGIVIITTSI
jgi:hypothetical protein